MQGAVNVDATGGNSLYMGEKGQEGKPKHNNYGRPEGQNVGNFLTDRNSSRVLAPPGERPSVWRISADRNGGQRTQNATEALDSCGRLLCSGLLQ